MPLPSTSRRTRRFESLESRYLLDSGVVFNELMYNAQGSDAQSEWIELHNQLAVDIDISDWRLAGGVDFTFPDETAVPGRGYIVIAAAPDALRETRGVPALGPWQGRLSNAGEELRLYNNDNRLMNVLEYEDGGDWPTSPDGSGLTLAKHAREGDSSEASNWTFSQQQGGTPGAINFAEPTLQVETLVHPNADAHAYLPVDDRLANDWLQIEFDDSQWLTGQQGVGFETQTSFRELIGLDLNDPPNGQDPQPDPRASASVYVRVPFDVPIEMATFDHFELRVQADDGYVAYINGTEVASNNAPGRSGNKGELQWDSKSTRRPAILPDVGSGIHQTVVTPEMARIRPGLNVLSIHGLNRSIFDADGLWRAELLGKRLVTPSPQTRLQINEVPSGSSQDPFIEVINLEPTPIELQGIHLFSTRLGRSVYTFTDTTIESGQRFAVRSDALNEEWKTGAHLLLMTSNQTVLDGIRVRDRAQAREETGDRTWMAPADETPGEINRFDLPESIVINEIMYHAQPRPRIADIPAEFASTTLLEMASPDWRYNDTGVAFSEDWHTLEYAVNGESWKAGPAPIGFDTAKLAVPIQTEITRPRDNDPSFITYYFQHSFDVDQSLLEQTDQLALTHLIDGGAIFYLNDVEVLRYNMPGSHLPHDHATVASRSVFLAELDGPHLLSTSGLRVGRNTLSVELHLHRSNDRAVVFGADLVSMQETVPLIPGKPYDEREEIEWIELYNKSSQTIDLSGWQITDGIEFSIPNGTQLAADQYLVIAKDAMAFREVYDEVPVMGNFTGSLNNQTDRIRLYDNQGRLADDVEYFEGGRWPIAADGGGSSLELIDVNANNNRGEMWAPSDEQDRGQWTNYQFSGTSIRDVFNGPALFNEFIFGLLSEGEFLIDDVMVFENEQPERSLIQNGTFEQDTVGSPPEKWRIIGNHQGQVVIDPTNADNQVLHVVAHGPQSYVHDHAETTFVDDTPLIDGLSYTISFRAKWLSGNSQLHNRLWSNRLPNTAVLDVPTDTGTPGRRNSTAIINSGPSYGYFRHTPTSPLPGQKVTVTAQPEDPDGIEDVKLWWRTDVDAWTTSVMTPGHNGRYQAEIPGQPAGTTVQFYVEAMDKLCFLSTFPSAGPESRALYQVERGINPITPIDRYQTLIMQSDRDALLERTNIMSNQYRGITLVHNATPYYDVSMRFVGNVPRTGYKVRLNPEQKFYGVHDSVRFDWKGLSEIVMKQMMNRAGGSHVTNYDDLALLVTPTDLNTSIAIVQFARYDSLFLNEQFVDGSEGTKWELDKVAVTSGTLGDRESLKTGIAQYGNGDIGINQSIAQREGIKPEFLRGHLLIKNKRAKDDYPQLVRLTQAIHHDDPVELFRATNEIMDVDLWMRHYANMSYLGNWDSYGFSNPKNLRLYLRPEDNRFIPLFWDCDSCNLTEPLLREVEHTSRLDEIRDIPHNLRLFWGHMLDMVRRSYNADYIARWAKHYATLVHGTNGSDTFDNLVERVVDRNQLLMHELIGDDESAGRIPPVDFQITTNQGNSVEIDTGRIELTGRGWVDIRFIRLAGTDDPLEVFWPETDRWQLDLPVPSGTRTISLEAIGYQGELIGTDTIDVTTTSSDPVFSSLRVTELQYHPAEPTVEERSAGFNDREAFEYLELTNIGNQTISLQDVNLTKTANGQGLDFDFSSGRITDLDPGASVVVVENFDAFAARYGDTDLVAGQWKGRLNNRSETIVISAGGVTIQELTYNDTWHPETDGIGRSLQIINAQQIDLARWNNANSWRPSSASKGTPGWSEPAPGDVDQNGYFDFDDLLILQANGEFDDDIFGNSTFAEGDFNGNGDFDSADLVWAFTYTPFTPVRLAARDVDHVFAN